MTGSEICKAARHLNPRIQLRDVWFVLRQMMKRNLAYCLNPGQTTGHLYFLADSGRRAVELAFRTAIETLPQDVDWTGYSFVARARTRRLVLLELSKPKYAHGADATASNLRKNLRDRHPLGLNSVMRALKELARQGLVAAAGVTIRRKQKIFRLTAKGAKIARELLR